MTADLIIILVLVVLNIPVYRFLYRLFFADDDDYRQSVKYIFTPNFVSFFRGEYWKDKIDSARVKFYILFCAMAIVLEYVLISKAIHYFRS